ncbi:hypothetical protein Z517_00702 [Fonsecaea pedrosoi CBS 271.37]|uniref:Calcineurin-like phosphoesterase domain-containing protein n=1 Tax=Fonsecaea pedrosoi CBS 271.37 TaxID=1442368 RepID=A0A0D2FF87_9EURO|nr:uncharacterized protein Z517_00702 [Fonsecaea pedrosoi CBS 271.37]KIW85312.1 hypothetical protein Z517_00702 [Fonsecaea pedrosoi CBS 271.37]
MSTFKRLLGCSNPRRLRFQILSDLHLETGNQYKSFQVPVQAPILILAGDIGRLHDYENYLFFISTQCAKFGQVCLVLGNHEFYGVSRAEGLELAYRLQREPSTLGKLSVLNRTRLDVDPSICVLGCTLQSHIRPENRAEVQSRIKDFRRIHDWSVDHHNTEHAKDVKWLRNEVESIRLESKRQGREKMIIVVTHHAPIKKGSSHPKHEGNPWADGFATDLLGVPGGISRVDWWIFGHTHFTNQWRQHGVHLVSNQRGYVLNPAGGTQLSQGPQQQPIWRVVSSPFAREMCFDPRKCIEVKAL